MFINCCRHWPESCPSLTQRERFSAYLFYLYLSTAAGTGRELPVAHRESERTSKQLGPKP